MIIDTKTDLDQSQDLHPSPSIAPIDEDAVLQSHPAPERIALAVLPRTRVAPERVDSKRPPAGGLAIAVLLLASAIYLAAIMAIAVCAIFCLPFSMDDPVTS
jgi:hypothetical protein